VNYQEPGAADMLPCSKAVPCCDCSPQRHTGLFSHYYPWDCKPFFLAGIITSGTSLLTSPFLNPEPGLLPQSEGLLCFAVLPSPSEPPLSFYLIKKNHQLPLGTSSFSYKCKIQEAFPNFTTDIIFPGN